MKNYESLVEGLILPDVKDRHVLAAAIKANADIIVTNNLKHFPKSYLGTYGLSAKNADNFITDLVDLDQLRAVEAFRKLVQNKRNPGLDEFQVLDRYRKNGLKYAADYLHSLI